MTAKKNPKTHGFNCENSTKEQHAFYTKYEGIRGRCNRTSNSYYCNYGGRGIKCTWESFGDFIEDMRDSYLEHTKQFGIKDTTIDRIDNDGDYCKENCRWATMKEQRANQRNSLSIEISGIKYSTRQIADKVGLPVGIMTHRISQYNKGLMTLDEVLNKNKLVSGLKNAKGVDVEGKHYSSKDISEICGIDISSARDRINKYKNGTIGKDLLFYRGKMTGYKNLFTSKSE